MASDLFAFIDYVVFDHSLGSGAFVSSAHLDSGERICYNANILFALHSTPGKIGGNYSTN